MAAGATSRILRGPGKLIVNPTDLTASSPYGGVEVGLVKSFVVQSEGQPILVWNESLGEATDILEGKKQVVASCFIRGWDDDAVEQFLADGYSVGGVSRHSVYEMPGTKIPGQSTLTRSVSLLWEPDDVLHVPAAFIYRAVPYWNPAAQMAWQRQEELGIPLAFHCIRDTSNQILAIGRISDLSDTIEAATSFVDIDSSPAEDV